MYLGGSTDSFLVNKLNYMMSLRGFLSFIGSCNLFPNVDEKSKYIKKFQEAVLCIYVDERFVTTFQEIWHNA